MAFTGYVKTGAPADGIFQFNPFVAGTKFRLVNHCFVSPSNDNVADKDVKMPAFDTTLSEPIRLTELYRPQMTADGKALEKNSAFAKDLVDTLIANRGKSTEEVLRAVVEKFKDKDLIVKSATPFRGKDRDGNEYTGTFRIYDYAPQA